MNGDRFDSLTRVIGSVASRRAVTRALAGATLGLAAARPGVDAAEAGTEPTRERSRRCRQGKTRCDGRCVDTATNRNHCGRCDKRCGAGKRCHAGTCLPSCAAVLTAAGCQRDDAGQWRCRGVDLSGAVLSGCDLSSGLFDQADLSGADLSGADLSGVDLTASVLTGADLDGADLTGVGWRDTTCPDGANSNAVGDTCCGHLNGAKPAAGC